MGEAVGIMGGTFDPIHFGHLSAAEEARVRFQLERVIFVPNRQAPHKKDYRVTAAERRWDMVVLATASNPHFETSRVELDRPGPSYSADTVRILREQLGDGAALYFITGADAVLEILTWHEPERLIAHCEIIAVTRPGYDLKRLEAALPAHFRERTHVLSAPGLDISSTELRKRAGTGGSLRYLTPGPVVGYIEGHRLYADGGLPGEGT
jgi:nicotinate-nucleotide adenylyltransferase